MFSVSSLSARQIVGAVLPVFVVEVLYVPAARPWRLSVGFSLSDLRILRLVLRLSLCDVEFFVVATFLALVSR